MTHRKRRSYDHRVKAQIVAAGDPDLFPELEIPRSTAMSWIRRGVGEVVACFSGFRLDLNRVPDAQGKLRLLSAVERARKSMPLSAALRVLRLSSARYHDWVGLEGCSLDDRSSCPRSKPQSLTYQEVGAIGDMVQSKDYRHMSIRGLALHAQRVGKVFAHPGTWAKLIRERGWGRPRVRLYPPKPKLGFRATGPNEAWHVDATIIKLLDATKAYLHAVIDNYSRRILAWTVAETLNPMNTCYVLQRAAAGLSDCCLSQYSNAWNS